MNLTKHPIWYLEHSKYSQKIFIICSKWFQTPGNSFSAGHQTLWHHTPDGNQGQLQHNLSPAEEQAEWVKMGTPGTLYWLQIKGKGTWNAPGNWILYKSQHSPSPPVHVASTAQASNAISHCPENFQPASFNMIN